MDLLQPQLMSCVIDDGVLGLSNGGTPDLGVLLVYGGRMIAFTVIGGACGLMNGITSKYGVEKTVNDVRKDCFGSIMRLSFAQIERFTTGSLITRLSNDLVQVQNLMLMLTSTVIRNLTFMIGGMICLFTLNRRFGLVVLAAAPFVLLLIIVMLLLTNPLFRKLQKKLDQVNEVMREDVEGIRVIKAFVRERYEEERFQEANDGMLAVQLRALLTLSYLNPLINIVLNLTAVAVIRAGGLEVQAGSASPGNVVAAITYVSQILNGILQIAVMAQSAARGTVSLGRIKELLECRPDIEDGSAGELPESKGRVVFENVAFEYEECDGPVISGVSLTFEPGQTTAILGASGSGKTSLVSLILRFYDVTEGAVYLDGINVKDYPLWELRQRVSFVFQTSELFNASIAENIKWGVPDASEEKIKKAASDAQALDFIERQSNQLNTLVAERGRSLSGGQKQRIAVSRALLSKASVLIFDDSSSALDARTEARLYQSLKEHYAERTKIIITQRIASIMDADQIVVIENGRVAGCGTHRELAAGNPVYREILRSQVEGGEEVG